MAQNTHKNTFEGGLVSDIDESIQPQGTYRNAYNVKLDKDGSNFIVSAMGGSETVVSIQESIAPQDLSSTLELTRIIGSVWAQTFFDSRKREAVWVFSVRRNSISSPWTFLIYAIDIENSLSYKIYEKKSSYDYLESNLDSIVFGEGGVNYIYATDGVDEPLRVKCVVETLNPAINRLSVELRPKGLSSVSPIIFNNIIQTGGSLRTGAYQFSYRLVRNEKLISGGSSNRNLYSKWSLITNPVLIHGTDTSSGSLNTYGAIAEQTTKRIVLRFSLTQEERDFYDYIEVAAIENLSGTTIPSQVAKKVLAKEIDSGLLEYNYAGSVESIDIPIEDIVVDSSSIKSYKTNAIKNNRLIVGNIDYKPLEYDNGNIEINPVSTRPILKTINRSTFDFFGTTSKIESSVKEDDLVNGRGYFRDEVYRFAISYYDDKGDFSTPQVIDFSGVSTNRSSSKDFRFPDRSELQFHILNQSNDPQNIGLKISGIRNHPSWAKGFVILRAPRKKKIKFQTPAIPSIKIEQQGVLGDYPTLATDENGTETTMSDAQPSALGELGTLSPKNFRHGISKSIVKNSSNRLIYDSSEGGTSRNVLIIFPPEDLYNTNGETLVNYQLSSSDYIKSVDACILNCIQDEGTRDPSDSAYDIGDFIETNVTSYMRALNQDDYYQSSGTKSNITETLRSLHSNDFVLVKDKPKIQQYEEISNLQSKGVINNRVVNYGDYDGLNATNGEVYPEGYPATNNKAKVILLDSSRWYDVAKYSFASNGGFATRNGLDYNGFTFSNPSSKSNYIAQNEFLPENTYVSAVEIINIEAPGSDQRYGSDDETKEFIFTGAIVSLTENEVVNNVSKDVDVFGGDCFVGFHQFKVSDTTYSISYDGSTFASAHAEKWKYSFVHSSGIVERAIPLKAHNQYIGVYLESEVEPGFQDRRWYDWIPTGTSLDPNESRAIYEDYGYNLSYSQQNTNKIFFKESILSQNRNKFSSRLLYSEPKIYQSDIEGFDKFPVLNFYDQDESHGEITKLINKDGHVYSIQQRAVSYIPTDSRLIETTDASILSVRSDEFISIPDYITTFNGSQDLSTVRESRDGFIFLDRQTRDLIKVSGKQVESIAFGRIKDYIEDSIENIENSNIFGFTSGYNIENEEYNLIGYSESGVFGFVYSNRFNIFTTKFNLPSILNSASIVFANNEIYIAYHNQFDLITLNKLDSLTDSYSILGGLDESSIEFVVNPMVEAPKMFNNTNIFSRGIMGTVTTTSNHVPGSSVVTLTPNDLVEGTYRIKTLRGENNRRLRGQYAKNNITWPAIFNSSDLVHVVTKFDVSRKPI